MMYPPEDVTLLSKHMNGCLVYIIYVFYLVHLSVIMKTSMMYGVYNIKCSHLSTFSVFALPVAHDALMTFVQTDRVFHPAETRNTTFLFVYCLRSFHQQSTSMN
jgi:hypothetical protein